MESLFSTRDPSEHQALRRPVAQFFSMTTVKTFEQYADECIKILVGATSDQEGQAINLGRWLQWYAFDVIGSITFQRRFGFMEQGKDVRNMVGDLEVAAFLGAVIGQIPALIPWSKRLIKLINAQSFLTIPDAFDTIVQVSIKNTLALPAKT